MLGLRSLFTVTFLLTISNAIKMVSAQYSAPPEAAVLGGIGGGILFVLLVFGIIVLVFRSRNGSDVDKAQAPTGCCCLRTWRCFIITFVIIAVVVLLVTVIGVVSIIATEPAPLSASSIIVGANWVPTEYGVCTLTGPLPQRPVQIRSFFCAINDDSVALENCPDVTTITFELSRECFGTWQEPEFSSCSVKSVDGIEIAIQERIVYCIPHTSAVIGASQNASAWCSSPQPETQQSCVGEWIGDGNWGPCEFVSTAVSSQEQGVVQCYIGGDIVADKHCSSPKPTSRLCGHQWIQECEPCHMLGNNNVTCGLEREQSCTVTCQTSDGVTQTDAFCATENRPNEIESCATVYCDYDNTTSSCDTVCGNGTTVTTFKCTNPGNCENTDTYNVSNPCYDCNCTYEIDILTANTCLYPNTTQEACGYGFNYRYHQCNGDNCEWCGSNATDALVNRTGINTLVKGNDTDHGLHVRESRPCGLACRGCSYEKESQSCTPDPGLECCGYWKYNYKAHITTAESGKVFDSQCNTGTQSADRCATGKCVVLGVPWPC